MCGIAGFLDGRYSTSEEAFSIAHDMADAVAHRGPDDAGVWLDSETGVALAHRRLAIIDPSPAGRQPMESVSGRHIITFNGEIYNHLDIRRQLEIRLPDVCSWRGHSDTETLLAAIECWGLEKALQAAVGMFAFALWDRQDRMLYLVRDRMGEKPLYYGVQNGVFLFGSELKALAMHPAFGGNIDRDMLTLLLRHNYIPSPRSIYRGVRKLPAGTYIGVALDAARKYVGELPEPQWYWSFRKVVADGCTRPFEGNPNEAVDALHDLLLRVVRQQMVADVPLGAFLSGGIDSSTIVALMQTQSERPVRTFTIGFGDPDYNEAEYAATVAKHLGTEHTELYVSAGDALEVISRLPALFDEPFADHSQIPTFMVAQMARRHVTVALSGDGGDEMFGGYRHYSRTPRLWQVISKTPASLCRFGAHAVGVLLPRGSGYRLQDGPLRQTRLGQRWSRAKVKARKLASLMECQSPEQLYCRQISRWLNPETVVRGSSEPLTVLADPASWPDAPDLASRLMAVDALSYLPEDILVKVDRSAMGVSLETRTPFLDHRVVEFAWRLPLSVKIRNGCRKWGLRQVLYKYVPKQFVERPKAGFEIPLASWLRGPLRDWAEALLDERRLQKEGFFDPQPVRQKWREHLSGRAHWDGHLWSVLMFQAWLEHNRCSG